MGCRRIGLLLLFVTGMALTAPVPAETNDWPQWLGPQRDGSSQEGGLLKEWPPAGPPQVWMSDQVGLGYAGSAIVAGTVYTMGSLDGTTHLIALDANSGDRRWARPIDTHFENGWGDGPRSTPSVDGDRVYAFTAAGTLVCFTADNGNLLWRRRMAELGGSVPFWGYSESPLLDGDLVLCTPGGSAGAVVAFDKYTGEVRWQSSDVADEAQYASLIKAAPNQQPQYIQLLMERVVGLSPEDGRLLWESPWPGSTAVIPTPIYRDGQLYLTTGYGVGCQLLRLEGTAGSVEVIYENKHMKNKHGGVVVVGDHIYGFSDGVGWLCQDWSTGEKVWSERKALGKGSLCYADGMLYCLGEDEGEVVLLEASPAGWQERGRFTLEPQSTERKSRGRIWTHPVVVNGKLYLRDQELLFCFDVKQGADR